MKGDRKSPLQAKPNITQYIEIVGERGRIGKSTAANRVRDHLEGSCPRAWCSSGGVITALAGMGRAGQAATAGSPTMGSSLKGPIVSSVI